MMHTFSFTKSFTVAKILRVLKLVPPHPADHTCFTVAKILRVLKHKVVGDKSGKGFYSS